MNIFYTNPCPAQCAMEHNTILGNKMIVESVQMLSTAHRVLDGDDSADNLGCIKATHKNHPSSVWVRQSSQHYAWLQQLAMALCEAYTERTGKVHAYDGLVGRLEQTPAQIDDKGFCAPPQAMPDEFKRISDVCVAYQKYLNSKFKDWLTRTDKRRMKVEFFYGKPEWLGLPEVV